MKRGIVLGIVLTLLLALTSTACFTPALAKNMHVPSGVSIFYYSEGNASIALPTPLPTGYPSTATEIKIVGVHIEGGGTGDAILVELRMTVPGMGLVTMPFAMITTNSDPEAIAFLQEVWRGTFMYYDKPLPGYVTTNNIIPVSEDTVTVERHGNGVTIDLTSEQTIQRPIKLGGVQVTFKLPAFHMELDKYGGSVHTTGTKLLPTSVGFSGYTIVSEHMGFYADATFTCSAWNLNAAPMSDAFVTMHGIQTYIPPP